MKRWWKERDFLGWKEESFFTDEDSLEAAFDSGQRRARRTADRVGRGLVGTAGENGDADFAGNVRLPRTRDGRDGERKYCKIL